MTNTNVLYVSIPSSKSSIMSLLGELQDFLDSQSQEVFQTLIKKRLIRDDTRNINQVEEVPFEQDVSFIEISRSLEERKLIPLSLSSCIDFLYALKGKENQSIRRLFFMSGGITLLSTESILIDGQLNYLVIGQDFVSEREDGQRLFSVRLLPAMKMFSHKLYRVIAAMV